MVKKKAAARKKAAKTVAGTGAKKSASLATKVKPEKDVSAAMEELRPTDSTGKHIRHHSTEKKKNKKHKVKFKSAMLREEAISYFEAIIAGLKRGSIQIRQGDDVIALKPSPQLDVEVKAASKNQDESIEFEIRWRTASDSELTISTD